MDNNPILTRLRQYSDYEYTMQTEIFDDFNPDNVILKEKLRCGVHTLITPLPSCRTHFATGYTHDIVQPFDDKQKRMASTSSVCTYSLTNN